jgi:nucleoside-diphosphate-sugar epimerase
MPTVLITGATGFVGSHVTHEAQRAQADVRLMSHRRPLAGSGRSVVRADLADPASLRGVCDGADVLIHCAAQIGGTAEANEAVNARGTAALIEEARRAGVRRVVHLSRGMSRRRAGAGYPHGRVTAGPRWGRSCPPPRLVVRGSVAGVRS